MSETMAIGSEVLLLLGAGFVVLGPKRMQAMLGQIGRAKAQFDKASRSLMADVTSSLDEKHGSDAGPVENDNHDTGLVLPDDLFERLLQHGAANR
jgi:Sec-independent protein translocase protein TatA